MQEIITLTVLFAGAIVAAVLIALGMSSAVHLTSTRAHGGYLHLIFYAMLFLVALSTLVSGRDMSIVSVSAMLVEAPAAPRHPLLVPAQPLISLLLLAVSGERIISYLFRRDNHRHGVRLLLLAVFVIFWTGSVAAPALLGAHPFMAYFYFYSLVIGSAAALATAIAQDKALKAVRNALLIFMAGSLLLVVLKPGLVLDSDYSQGLLPGVPRLAGLAAHAVSLGILAQLGLLCLYARPYASPWLNRLAWIIGLSALFLAQSKAAWISFSLCFMCLVAVRDGARLRRRLNDSARPGVGIFWISVLMVLVLSIMLVLMFGDLDSRLSSFFNSREGAQLASLTGRDKIWAIAWQEWQRNPVFGYGPLIWETDFRLSIGMPNATHAHNQFMDTLSRSGSVGAAALVLYGVVLMVLSLRYTRASGGLSLALFLTLFLRSISEVPLSLFGYGAEMIAHVLLLMTLAATASTVRVRKTHAAPTRGSVVHPGLRPAGNPLPTVNFNP